MTALVVGLSAVAAGADEPTSRSGYYLPFSSSEQGRELFVNKGCVVCHAVNGIGGEIAPALDAGPSDVQIDAFDFAARMWRGAGAMIAFQNLEFGFQIDMNGEELAHIARFLHDREAQQSFGEDDIPENIRQLMRAEALKELEL
jgi:mono/diheme cytochrome c family protein